MAVKKSPVKKDELEKVKCLKCGKLKSPNTANFYNNTNNLFSSEKLEICKECIQEFIGSKETEGYKSRVISMLAILDKPFSEELWSTSSGEWAKYITPLSSLPQYKTLTFKDSDFYQQDSVLENLSKNEVEENDYEVIVTPKLRMFWRGYNDEQIVILENMFQDLTSTYECSTPIQKSLYRNMTITQYMADNAKTPTEFDKLMGTLSKLMNDANIKPVQETGAEANGISSFGEFIKMIEETEPIPEPRDEFKDVDGIGKYINKWFLHHMKRFIGQSNETMEEYDEKEATKKS
ncbi:hypothetical protein [Paenibacillus tianjinensis]|uniref:DUF4145 domain-containing protein n=1 Tax=Paenibacillus tianjinensis TaxID=2810347 RepID=A0ABX7L5Y6_9BACL|nr:hypothetical protein [Paenibacillus tianjinensis]QSF43527.1 hypothetical protein JRJ22_19895 [Paenibacillus tianjinensis]